MKNEKNELTTLHEPTNEPTNQNELSIQISNNSYSFYAIVKENAKEEYQNPLRTRLFLVCLAGGIAMLIPTFVFLIGGLGSFNDDDELTGSYALRNTLICFMVSVACCCAACLYCPILMCIDCYIRQSNETPEFPGQPELNLLLKIIEKEIKKELEKQSKNNSTFSEEQLSNLFSNAEAILNACKNKDLKNIDIKQYENKEEIKKMAEIILQEVEKERLKEKKPNSEEKSKETDNLLIEENKM